MARVSSDVPSKKEFARLVATMLREAKMPPPITINDKEFLIVFGEGSVCYLNNIYFEFCVSLPEQRMELLAKFVRGGANAFGSATQTMALSELLPNLLPRLRSQSHLESQKIELAGPGQSFESFCRITEHFGVELVVDRPESFLIIVDRTLEGWGLTFDDALAKAIENLRKRSERPFKLIRPGLYVSQWGDCNDASRLILHDLIRQLKVKGQPVAVVPNSNLLLVTGDENDDCLIEMAKIAARERDNPPRPMSGYAVRLEGSQWVTFLPPQDHPAYWPFKVLQLRGQQMDYENQREILDKRDSKGECRAMNSRFVLSGVENGSKMWSQSMWVGGDAGYSSRLPKTDEIIFMITNDEFTAKLLCIGEWDRVQAVMGPMMNPLGLYPERWLVEQFPSREQLDAAGVKWLDLDEFDYRNVSGA